MHSDDGEDFLGLNKTLASSILIKFADNEISDIFSIKHQMEISFLKII